MLGKEQWYSLLIPIFSYSFFSFFFFSIISFHCLTRIFFTAILFIICNILPLLAIFFFIAFSFPSVSLHIPVLLLHSSSLLPLSFSIYSQLFLRFLLLSLTCLFFSDALPFLFIIPLLSVLLLILRTLPLFSAII